MQPKRDNTLQTYVFVKPETSELWPIFVKALTDIQEELPEADKLINLLIECALNVGYNVALSPDSQQNSKIIQGELTNELFGTIYHDLKQTPETDRFRERVVGEAYVIFLLNLPDEYDGIPTQELLDRVKGKIRTHESENGVGIRGKMMSLYLEEQEHKNAPAILPHSANFLHIPSSAEEAAPFLDYYQRHLRTEQEIAIQLA